MRRGREGAVRFSAGAKPRLRNSAASALKRSFFAVLACPTLVGVK